MDSRVKNNIQLSLINEIIHVIVFGCGYVVLFLWLNNIGTILDKK